MSPGNFSIQSTAVLRERLAARITERDLSARALSRAIGANESYAAQLISGKGGMPSADKLARMAEVLDTSVEWLLGETGNPAPIAADVSVRDLRHDPHGQAAGPPIPLVGTGDCAELSVTDAETGQEITVERSSFDPEFHVRYVRRPPALDGASGIYAIYFHGSSMEPRFFAGEIGLVDPRRPPGPGDYVLVQLNGGDSDEVTSVLVKRLVRQTSAEYLLEQHNPHHVFAVPRTRVARVHRLLPPSELLG